MPPRGDSPSSHRLQHSHSDLSPHHSLNSASMSPLFDQNMQQPSQAGLPQSRHSRSVTADQLSWPRGFNRGQEGGGGRGEWAGVNAVAGSESDLLSRRLRVDVISPVRHTLFDTDVRCFVAMCSLRLGLQTIQQDTRQGVHDLPDL